MMKLGISLLLILMPICVSAQNVNKEKHSHDHGDKPHSSAAGTKTAILEKKTVAATPVSPAFVQLAKNVEVIPNIEDALKTVGVLTHEGVFGPLLFAEKTRAFFIELKPGMFLFEHPHSTGSIVYTVRGKWVLASEGKRQVMEAGSLFRFGDNMPTGWEAPFADGALLLVVKSKKKGEAYEPFIKGLNKMKVSLDKERAKGNKFYFNELKPDHPAIVFARSVNPNFDEVLKNIRY